MVELKTKEAITAEDAGDAEDADTLAIAWSMLLGNANKEANWIKSGVVGYLYR